MPCVCDSCTVAAMQCVLLVFLVVIMWRVVEQLRRVSSHPCERREMLPHEDDERDDDMVR